MAKRRIHSRFRHKAQIVVSMEAPIKRRIAEIAEGNGVALGTMAGEMLTAMVKTLEKNAG